MLGGVEVVGAVVWWWGLLGGLEVVGAVRWCGGGGCKGRQWTRTTNTGRNELILNRTHEGSLMILIEDSSMACP